MFAALTMPLLLAALPFRDERLLPGVAVFLAAARPRPLPLLAHKVGEVLQGGAP